MSLMTLLAKVNKRIPSRFRLLGLPILIAALSLNAAGYDLPIQGAFTVSFVPGANPSTFPAGCLDASLQIPIEAHGIGITSLGTAFMDVYKALTLPGNMQGCAILRTADGDTLNANYTGTIDAPNVNGFSNFSGKLQFTGGTGRFKNVSGTATFTAIAGFGDHVAFYSVQGSLSVPDSD